jgi:hypothetical protein
MQRVPHPIAARAHAHFQLAVEALSQRRFDDAKGHFEACRDGAGFQFYVYWLTRAIGPAGSTTNRSPDVTDAPADQIPRAATTQAFPAVEGYSRRPHCTSAQSDRRNVTAPLSRDIENGTVNLSRDTKNGTAVAPLL